MACVDLRGRDCLVVGGGRVATEKAQGLLDCNAHVTVVAPQVDDELRRLPVHVVPRAFEPADADGRFLVIAATNDRAVNVVVSAAATGLCNVADDPELCNFILPAVHRQGSIAVAVSTGGASPALAKRLRSQIAELVQPEHAELAEELRALRPEVQARFETYEERRDYFEELVTERLS